MVLVHGAVLEATRLSRVQNSRMFLPQRL